MCIRDRVWLIFCIVELLSYLHVNVQTANRLRVMQVTCLMIEDSRCTYSNSCTRFSTNVFNSLRRCCLPTGHDPARVVGTTILKSTTLIGQWATVTGLWQVYCQQVLGQLCLLPSPTAEEKTLNAVKVAPQAGRYFSRSSLLQSTAREPLPIAKTVAEN